MASFWRDISCRLGALVALTMGLAQCAAITSDAQSGAGDILAREEKALGTQGVIARYHALLRQPRAVTLSHSGFLIGIEKAPRALIGLDPHGGFDSARLKPPSDSVSDSDSAQQDAHFRRVTSEPKAMFVSHVLEYLPTKGATSIAPSLIYSAYSETAFDDRSGVEPKMAYEKGWDALDKLEARILDAIETQAKTQRPFTHIVFMAMGWNNDQFEAIQGYNALMHNMRVAARSAEETREFLPLVIGLTWPSVWGGTSVSDLANRALHIGSYGVKADDSDEIGYGIANHIVNSMLPRLEAKMTSPSILIGHSMGARILTRAYFSGHILRGRETRPGRGPLVIGLQGAFSANRFKPDYRLVPPVRWVFSGEGGPYQNVSSPNGSLVLTWSRHDRANPFARIATGAQHVGAGPGSKVMQAMTDKVDSHDWAKPDATQERCARVRDRSKVLYINAGSIVKSHGDIGNPQVGALVWEMIYCYTQQGE